MTPKFHNPLVIPAVAQLIKATTAEFSFGWSIKLKRQPTPDLWRHFDDALNYLFVSDEPTLISQRRLPPTRWFAVPKSTSVRGVVYYGLAKVPSPNLCASGLISGMCRPVGCYLQSEMGRRGFECQISVVHVGAMLNNTKYDRQWEANADGAITDYLGQPNRHGTRSLASQHGFVSIVTEAEPIGIDLLFTELQQ